MPIDAAQLDALRVFAEQLADAAGAAILPPALHPPRRVDGSAIHAFKHPPHYSNIMPRAASVPPRRRRVPVLM